MQFTGTTAAATASTRWEKDGKVNYFTNLDAWRMESVKIGQENGVAEVNYNDIPPSDTVDDLPF